MHVGFNIFSSIFSCLIGLSQRVYFSLFDRFVATCVVLDRLSYSFLFLRFRLTFSHYHATTGMRDSTIL
ncbi:hypothetical protein Hanom_Chr13g01194981 [Helianthus anomalus]